MIIEKYKKFVTLLNEKVTKYFAMWLVFPLIFALIYDCIGRYVFNHASSWSYDITWIMYGSLWVLGGGYLLSQNGHVRVDVLFERMPARMQSVVTILCYLLLFFPLTIALVYACGTAAIQAYAVNQTTATTLLRIPTWIMRGTLFIGFALLLLQGLAQFLTEILALIQGKKNREVT
jgi:TRAP-type mannitol/chloroaromatic compound transport system permease small subunit